MANTVIVGAGIIGLSSAYYLAQHQPASSIHLVDSSSELFASASGYAGGFLAADWFKKPVAALGRLSFEEHARLAREHGGRRRWGYAKTVTLAYEHGGVGYEDEQVLAKDWLTGGGSRAREAGSKGEKVQTDEHVPAWLRRVDGDSVSVMDDGSGTAIVDPLKLCQFLLDEVKAAGVHVYHPATALAVETDVRGELASVRIGYTDSSTEVEVPATRVLVAAGAWTPQVFSALFHRATVEIPVAALAGHSLVVRNPHAVVEDEGRGGQEEEQEEEPCHAVYCSFDTLALELYARPSGVIYLAGVNSSAIPLPALATGSRPEPGPLAELGRVARRVVRTDGNGDLEVVRTGLCFRPVTPRGVPILARVEDRRLGVATRPGAEGGVFVAVGHGPWGIALGLGTGAVVADMMQGRKPRADVDGLGL